MNDESKIKIIQDPPKTSAIEEIPQDLKATTLSGLKELQNLLPHGDLGRIVNSFIFINHPDAVLYQRRYRQKLYNELRRVDPFAFTYEEGCLEEEEQPDNFFLFFSVGQSGGWGHISHCKKCKIPLRLEVFHESEWMNLKISDQNANSSFQYKGCKRQNIGFILPIDRCLCSVGEELDEEESDEEEDSDENEYVPYD